MGVWTSYRRHSRRRHLGSKMAVPEITSSRAGVGFWVLNEAEEQDGGPSPSGRYLGWPHFRFLCVLRNFWCTGSGNEVIQDGDPKGKGRHLAPLLIGDSTICPIIPGHHLFRWRHVVCSAPSRYLNEYWFTVKWNLRNRLHLNFN